MVFNEARVEKMVLNYREMVPSIYLEVDNSDGNINQYLLTQYNNIMKVIFTPAIDGTYKKVSLRFTINSQGPIEGTNKILEQKKCIWKYFIISIISFRIAYLVSDILN